MSSDRQKPVPDANHRCIIRRFSAKFFRKFATSAHVFGVFLNTFSYFTPTSPTPEIPAIPFQLSPNRRFRSPKHLRYCSVPPSGFTNRSIMLLSSKERCFFFFITTFYLESHLSFFQSLSSCISELNLQDEQLRILALILPGQEGRISDFIDRGYDTNEIIKCAKNSGIQPVIPPRKNRKIQCTYDEVLYKKCHLVKNTFLRLNHSWRGIATRYIKRLSSFVAFVNLACAMVGLN